VAEEVDGAQTASTQSLRWCRESWTEGTAQDITQGQGGVFWQGAGPPPPSLLSQQAFQAPRANARRAGLKGPESSRGEGPSPPRKGPRPPIFFRGPDDGEFLMDQDASDFGSKPSTRRCSAQFLGGFDINRSTVRAFGWATAYPRGILARRSMEQAGLRPHLSGRHALSFLAFGEGHLNFHHVLALGRR
jgi:hypothetical protein